MNQIPNQHLLCREVLYGSGEYRQTVDLRNEILRRPLGLVFSEEQLRAEAVDIHLACYYEETHGGGNGHDSNCELAHEFNPHPPGLPPRAIQLVACLILTPRTPDEVQMRQFAVAAGFQRRSVGRVLMRFAEARARRDGFRLMTLHARESAAPFYEKNGYERVGERYSLVGIPHFNMRKPLPTALPPEPGGSSGSRCEPG